MKKKLLVSFSGGRTSAYMLWWILNNWQDQYEIIVVFANTGKEHEGTLEFVRRCAIEFGVEIIWVEGEPVKSKRRKNKKGKWIGGKWWGVKANVVSFETACRNGDVFERFISKLGIPTTNAPWCSDQMKKYTINAYLRQIGWKGHYTAIGMRYDEPDRIKPEAVRIKNRLLYPVYDHTVMSEWDILAWWKQQSFDLDIPKGLGNCENCWKKNMNILTNNARKHPHTLTWWQAMTDKYGRLNPRKVKLKPPFNFYRGNLSPKDIFELSKKSIEEINKISVNHKAYGCSESCEAF